MANIINYLNLSFIKQYRNVPQNTNGDIMNRIIEAQNSEFTLSNSDLGLSFSSMGSYNSNIII
jgi:hypothetical protein